MNRSPHRRGALLRLLAGAGLVSFAAAAGTGHRSAQAAATLPTSSAGSCTLGVAGRTIQHVMYFQFDNVHFRRDLPNVPSDLEQMPHLLSFIENNGVLLTNHHTPLISHTSEDILTSLTGVYPNRHGVAVGQNSYQYYNSSGSPTPFTTAFTYWTDTIGNGTYNMLAGAPTAAKPTGTNAPAPWVPYTRAGCDVGGVATANIELENNNVNSKFGANDIGNVFGANSPEAAEPAAQRTTDFVGIAIHCSQADSSTGGMCSSANHGRPDVLPDEPGGYSGFSALYGHKYVAPVISPSGPVTDINGNTIKDSSGNPGFPGFDGMNAAVSLGYVADMQEHGVPVTYAYISDAHDLAGAATHTALGPGEQAYVQQLKSYDDAWAAFFARLAKDGITPSNSLFVFTTDENDHFNGALPTNMPCSGATIDNTQNPPVVTPGNYCTYNKTPSTTPPGPPFGEVAVGLDGLLASEQNLTNYTFTVGNDTAPGIYLNGNPSASDPSTRTFERATGALTVTNPLTGRTETLAQYLAGPTEMNILHTVTADPSRTPTFLLFSRPDYYVTATCSGGFDSTPPPKVTPSCVLEEPAFAWLHGNVQPDVTNIWLGLVGPGVSNLGVDSTTWSDHTDTRPTMMALLGLKDDYAHDGRVLYEDLDPSVMPSAVQSQRSTILSLARLYKQLNAPVGQFGMATLQLSTTGLDSGSGTNDSTFASIDATLAGLGAQRDVIASQIIAALEAAEFSNTPIDPAQASAWSTAGWNLIARADELSGDGGIEIDWRSLASGRGEVLFGTGPGCSGLVMAATQDLGAGTEHHIIVTGNDLPSTAGNNGLNPGTTYWYELVTITSAGQVVDNNGGHCYSFTIPGP